MNKLTRVAIMAAISAPSILAGTAWADTTVVQGDSTVVLPTCVDVAPTPAVPGTPAVPAVPAVTHNVTVVDSPAVPATEGTPAIPAVTHDITVVDTAAVTHFHTYIVKNAYDETVIDSPAVPEVPGTPAVPAVTHVVSHAAVTHVVSHAAVTHQVTITDYPAVPAVAEVSHTEYKYEKQVTLGDGHGNVKAPANWVAWEGSSTIISGWVSDQNSSLAGVQVVGLYDAPNVHTLDAVAHHGYYSNGKERVYRYHAIDTRKVIDVAAKPAVPAVTHTETVTDTAAYDETVIDIAAYDETVVDSPAIPATEGSPGIPAVTHVVHHDAVKKIVTIIDTPAVTHIETVVDKAAVPAVPATPFIPAVTHVETIVDSVAVPGKPAAKGRHAKPGFECPTVLPHTGANSNQDWAIAGIAFAVIAAGGTLVVATRRRKGAHSA